MKKLDTVALDTITGGWHRFAYGFVGAPIAYGPPVAYAAPVAYAPIAYGPPVYGPVAYRFRRF